MISFNSCLFVSELGPAECAAWVQAIGGVLAIFASAGLVYLQFNLASRREKMLELSEHKSRLETVFQLCSYSKQVTKRVVDNASMQPHVDETSLQHALGEFDAILVALKKYESKDFADYSQLSPFMAALAATIAARSVCESARSNCMRIAVNGTLVVALTPICKELQKSEALLGNLWRDYQK